MQCNLKSVLIKRRMIHDRSLAPCADFKILATSVLIEITHE